MSDITKQTEATFARDAEFFRVISTGFRKCVWLASTNCCPNRRMIQSVSRPMLHCRQRSSRNNGEAVHCSVSNRKLEGHVMPEFTVEMHQAMAQALRRARHYLIANFPDEGEHLLCVMLASGFADMLRYPDAVTQQALVDVANDRLADTPWHINRRRAN
jgi:hypothetical protein